MHFSVLTVQNGIPRGEAKHPGSKETRKEELKRRRQPWKTQNASQTYAHIGQGVCILVRVSITMINHHGQKQVEKESVYLVYTSTS